MIEMPATHTQGTLTIENEKFIESAISEGQVDFGLQIAKDGRVWVCVNGIAFLRFKPRHD